MLPPIPRAAIKVLDDFVRFGHPELEQSKTGNDKNERVFMHSRMSVDGMSFLSLQYQGPFPCFVFVCSFDVGLKRILDQFSYILGTRPTTRPKYTNSPSSISKAVVDILTNTDFPFLNTRIAVSSRHGFFLRISHPDKYEFQGAEHPEIRISVHTRATSR